jgi:predicted aspartyl protease
MGLTGLSVEIANVARPEETRQIELLIDLGAIYSVVPATTLDQLGIKPLTTQDFRLADGRKISRRKESPSFGIRIGSAARM